MKQVSEKSIQIKTRHVLTNKAGKADEQYEQ